MAESETEQQIDASATPAIASIVRPIDVWPAEWAGEIARAASQSLFESITQPLREFERLKVDLVRQSLAFERLRMPTKYLEEVLGQQRQAQALIDALNVSSWLTWPASPRRRPYTPERPPEPIEVVRIEAPDDVERLNAALTQAGFSWAEARDLLLQQVPASKPGPKGISIEEKRAIVQGWYAIRGSRGKQRALWEPGDLMENYARKVGYSRAQLYRFEKEVRAEGHS